VEYAGGAAEGRLPGTNVASIPSHIQLRKENIFYHLYMYFKFFNSIFTTLLNRISSENFYKPLETNTWQLPVINKKKVCNAVLKINLLIKQKILELPQKQQ
jgi:hypothetical protein